MEGMNDSERRCWGEGNLTGRRELAQECLSCIERKDDDMLMELLLKESKLGLKKETVKP